MSETWKPVVGFEGHYEVSDAGNIRRVSSSSRSKPTGKFLSPGRQKSGHLFVNFSVGNKQTLRRVHVVVLTAFKGPRPKGLVCRHLDGNPANNNVSNLEWGTPQQNSDDRKLHGRSNKGTRHGMAVLNDRIVIEMRAIRRHLKWTFKKIGQVYGVNRKTASRAVTGEYWSHI